MFEENATMAQKLFVGSMAFSTTTEGLRAFFAKSGTVVSAAIVTEPGSDRSRGFGFVEMATAEEATKAVNELNGRDLDGRALKVEISKPKSSGGGSSSGFAGRSGSGNWR
jgi:cold-inducible RNA-binding protein